MSPPESEDPFDTSFKTDHTDNPHSRTYMNDSDRQGLRRMDEYSRYHVPKDHDEAEQIHTYEVDLAKRLDPTDAGHEARGTIYTEDDPEFSDKPRQGKT